jgi:NAD+ diphosphatase
MTVADDTRGEFMPTFGPASGIGQRVTLSFIGDSLLVASDDSLAGQTALADLSAPPHRLAIGRAGNTGYEIQVWPGQTPVPGGLHLADFRKLFRSWPHPFLDAACRAKQLASWLHENRFCGVCGKDMETALRVPVRSCLACGFLAYPRLAPVCIVLVARGDQLLLARSPRFPSGIYSTLAGYVEAGEAVEACVHREVREEVGIEIRNLRWFGSQCWPFPHSLMLGFFADYAGGELVLQAEEIEDARWYRRDRLPTLPHPSTIAYRMIQAWLAQEGGSVWRR